MTKKIIVLGVMLFTFALNSCVKDLDIQPIDPNSILAGNLNDDPEYLKQVLGKIYASFIISGQGANGGDDISAPDGNFFTTTRAYWNLQEITTDEAICAWGDAGISDLNTQTWSPQNPFLTAVFQRLSLTITYANEYIKFTNGNTNADVVRYNAEARFLRALSYAYAIDLFGKFPYTTEADGVGKFFPVIKDRTFLFNYVESELKAIEDLLGEPRFSYPQADKGAAWMLLARLYLNAQVYTGTARWEDCKTYTDKIISSGKYTLATNYRQNFSADNGATNPEMIFAWEQDGVYTQGYVGTTFIIESSSDAVYLRAEDYHGLTSNTNWNGNRARKEFVNVMIDTIATYGAGNSIPNDDPTFTTSKDKRVFLKIKKNKDIPSASSSGDYGIGVYKFTARNSDGSFPGRSASFADTDFPIFRFADAYMMRAEANFRLGNTAGAAADINMIRARAFGDATGNITAADVTADFILNERGREFYYEAQRRTDLIRFGKFTQGYNWSWKGGVFKGTNTSDHLNLFPIPGDEISANPNYNGENNPGY